MRDFPIIGNLTADPELRFTPAGVAVVRFTVAHTPRVRKGDQWEDGTPTFMDCTAWRELAEHIAASLEKGHRVVVVGNLETQQWETKDAEKRSKLVLQVTGVGPDLTYATATVKRMTRTKGNPDDPWATGSKERPADNGAPLDSEPPF